MKGKAIKVANREHAPQQNRATQIAAGNANYAIETFGERFADGSAIELVVDGNEDTLLLVFWDGVNAEITHQRLEHNGRIFIPPAAAGDVVKAMQLPTRVGSYGSTSQLLSAIGHFLAQHPGLGSDSVSKLAHFPIATWFPECSAKRLRCPS